MAADTLRHVTIRIVTDSACDLPADVVEQYRISIVPLTIRFGEVELTDRTELSPAEFWARCASSPRLPETAAPSAGQFEATYRQLADEGADGIVVVSLSGELSATYQSAELAAQSVTDIIPVRVVDSRSVSLGIGTIALGAAGLAETGVDLHAVEAHARDLASRTKVFGALDTLENLKKGGRIGNARALLGTALSIKPLIEVRDGVVEDAGKQRTRSKALKHVVNRLATFEGHIEHLAVLHADCSDVDDFVAMVSPYADGKVVVGEIGPVVGTHAGRGTIGVAFVSTQQIGDS